MAIQITYRSDLDRPLTSLEADANNRAIVEAIERKADEGDAAGIPEAPLDGAQYARQGGQWSVVVTGGGEPAGISHAASDGKLYGSMNGAWMSFTPGIGHGPSDGLIRGSKDGAWVLIPSGSGGGGDGNLRHRGAWSKTTSYQQWDVVEHAGTTWIARDTYGTQAPAPAFAQEGYWLPLGFPGSDTLEPSAGRILHRFSTADRTTLEYLSDILNGFERRLKALGG